MSLVKQKNFIFMPICCFCFGFLIGNLFGIFLSFLGNQFIWTGTILLVILISFEILNFLIYNTNKKFINKIFKNLQFGIFLGFFIDAFKVGS
uniref:Ycf20 n=1 Tax=Chlorodesmis fastigiata TaxID=189431 RepID=A0A2P0QIZ4_CHLFS|nr:hypothetical protein [Chlorodesmis fastigiata]ARO74218.1 hypothetical protein [Chlorodesmis fastigiata]